jgi:hypothetical protein
VCAKPIGAVITVRASTGLAQQRQSRLRLVAEVAFLRYFWWKNSISDIATGGVGFPIAGKIDTM